MTKQVKVQTIYNQVLNLIQPKDFDKSIQAQQDGEVDHFLFVVKSHYGIGQFENLNIIKSSGLYFAVDKNGVVKFEIAMNDKNQILYLSNESYNRIEASI